MPRRERPDRNPHADMSTSNKVGTLPQGMAARGVFEVTRDITGLCSADLFSSVGKKTPVFARFSPVTHERVGWRARCRLARGM